MKNPCKCCDHFNLCLVDDGYCLKKGKYISSYESCSDYKGLPVDTNPNGL